MMQEKLKTMGIKSITFEMMNIQEVSKMGIKMVFEEEAFEIMKATLMTNGAHMVIPGKTKGKKDITLWRIGSGWFKISNQKAYSILKKELIDTGFVPSHV